MDYMNNDKCLCALRCYLYADS